MQQVQRPTEKIFVEIANRHTKKQKDMSNIEDITHMALLLSLVNGLEVEMETVTKREMNAIAKNSVYLAQQIVNEASKNDGRQPADNK
jgi:hypothetical protein